MLKIFMNMFFDGSKNIQFENTLMVSHSMNSVNERPGFIYKVIDTHFIFVSSSFQIFFQFCTTARFNDSNNSFNSLKSAGISVNPSFQ